jgi:ribonuclease HI
MRNQTYNQTQLNIEVKTQMSQKLQIYTDGGARGNPGPSAIAFIALNERGETVKENSRFIGVRTNNQAEYEALLMALKFATEHATQEIICHLDSELVVKQLNGQYAVKNYQLQQLWQRVQEFKKSFKKISFVNVPRTNLQIQRADALVNKTLDEQEKNSL